MINKSENRTFDFDNDIIYMKGDDVMKCLFLCLLMFSLSACAETANVSKLSNTWTWKEINERTLRPEENDLPLEKQEHAVQVNTKQLSLQQSIQENGYYCGPASIQMILRYKGIEKSQQELAEELVTSSITGTEYADMARVLNAYIFDGEPIHDNDGGYRVQTLTLHDDIQTVTKTFEQRMRKNIDEQYPSLIAINLHSLYPNLPNANHVVVLMGYQTSDSDEITHFYILDPYDKVQDANYGGLKLFTSQEIIQAVLENDEPAYVW